MQRFAHSCLTDDVRVSGVFFVSCCENRFNVVVSIEVDCDKACHLYGIVEDAACGF